MFSRAFQKDSNGTVEIRKHTFVPGVESETTLEYIEAWIADGSEREILMVKFRGSIRKEIRTELVKSSAEYLTTLVVAPWFPYPTDYQMTNQAAEKYRNTLIGIGILALICSNL